MFRRLAKQDYYQVLELGYDATPDQIQLAYEEARKIYNHDALVSGSILSEDERRRTFERIAVAYQTLIAEESRRLYDESIGLAEPTRPSPIREKAGAVETGIHQASSVPKRSSDSKAERTSIGSTAAVEPPSPTKMPPPDAQPLQLGLTEEATGEFLRRAREAVGLDLSAIAKETKIGVAMLQYIEEERVERLPAAVYLRNFTLQVARCLGLDEEKVSRTYLARIRRMKEPSAQA